MPSEGTSGSPGFVVWNAWLRKLKLELENMRMGLELSWGEVEDEVREDIRHTLCFYGWRCMTDGMVYRRA